MVYFSGSRPKRSPGVRLARILIGILAVAAIVYALSALPYDVLRMERHRLFGEVRTIGRVTALRTDSLPQQGLHYFVDYKYVDSDGLARRGTARVPRALWIQFGTGDRLNVLFARSRPGLSRIPGEVETPFQQWLRRMLD
jgi:hypothetical protein